MISWNARFAVVALALASTAVFLQARGRNDVLPTRTVLVSFPAELGGWEGADTPIPQEILKKLGPGEFLQRVYRDQKTGDPDVDLYVVYHPNQHALQHHLPEECLVGSGWSLTESGTTILSLAGDPPFPANRYLITKGSDRQLVLFWYWAHGRRLASQDRAEYYLILDSLLRNRADNALIRINTRLRAGEEPEDAQQRLLSFAAQINPLLNNYIPR